VTNRSSAGRGITHSGFLGDQSKRDAATLPKFDRKTESLNVQHTKEAQDAQDGSQLA